MRVALYHNLTSGGSKREAYELTRKMAAHGHVIDLYCPATANEDFLSLKGIVKEQYLYPFQLNFPRAARLPALRKYLDLYKECLNLQNLENLSRTVAQDIDSRKYDFAFVHHDMMVQSPYLLKYLNTPSVYYCAEPMREFYEPMISRPYQKPKGVVNILQRAWYSPANQIKKAVIKSADRRNVIHAHLLLTNSRFSSQAIEKAYGLKARVSYLGVDEQKFIPLKNIKKNMVLSVGAVSALKGYDFLIYSIALIPKSERPELFIVGNTASEGEVALLRSLAEERGVTVKFFVNVADDQLIILYNEAKAFVYSPVREPFGLAPLEAMACQVPVIAVKEGGVQESVIDEVTGFLTARKPDQFAEALKTVLADEELAEKLGRQGREEVLRNWTWEQAYVRFVNHVNILLKAVTKV